MEPRSNEHLSAERLQAFLERELPGGEVARVEEHLATCARCTEELDGWRLLFEDLSGLAAHAPTVGFRERVLAAVELPGRLSLAARLRRRAGALVARPSGEHVAGERLQDLLDGSLPTRRLARVHAHLDDCAACAGELEAWRSVYARLAGLEGFAPAPGFAERVMVRLRATPAALRVAAWRRALVAARRFVPRTRRAWATISGIALTPAVTVALVIYTVFSHPTLTPQALASFVLWKLTDLFAAGSSALAAATLDGAQILGVDVFVRTLIDAPFIVAAGALAYSVVSVLALRVLYKNLMGGGRYARLSLR